MCKISVEILVQFQKIPITDIENFAISAADILPIQYIGTPLLAIVILNYTVLFIHLLTAVAASESLTLLKALQKSLVMSVDFSQMSLMSSMVSALLAA